MKILHLSNPSYRYLEQSFSEWLDVLGYSPKTIKSMAATVRELMYYMEQKEVMHIKSLNSQLLKNYYENHLTQRANKVRSGGLSNGALNAHISSIRKFLDYLRKVGRLIMPQVPFRLEKTQPRTVYLTVEEILLLFKTTYEPVESATEKKQHRSNLMAGRDRAMLAVYYSCGLRRNEGISLEVADVNFDKSLVHVRKGKKNKQRFVPISKASLAYLQEYMYDHRPQLLKGSKSEKLFIGTYGKALGSQSLLLRLKALQYLTGDLTLQEKEIGLHTLRHSIATHLLAAGMSLENISKFLGHSSLESTQVYTHLLDIPQQQPFSNIPKYETGLLKEDDYA